VVTQPPPIPARKPPHVVNTCSRKTGALRQAEEQIQQARAQCGAVKQGLSKHAIGQGLSEAMLPAPTAQQRRSEGSSKQRGALHRNPARCRAWAGQGGVSADGPSWAKISARPGSSEAVMQQQWQQAARRRQRMAPLAAQGRTLLRRACCQRGRPPGKGEADQLGACYASGRPTAGNHRAQKR